MKVTINPDIYKQIQGRIKHTDFKTVREYINFILEEVLKKLDEEAIG